MLEHLKIWLGLENFRAAVLVCMGGIVGGIGAIAVPVIAEKAQPGLLPALATLIAGPIAAIIAVLFILNVDRRDTVRLLALAIICGLAGQDILTTGRALALQLIGKARVEWNSATNPPTNSP